MSEIPQPPKSVWPIFVIGFVALALFLLGSKALLSLSGPAADEGAARSEERTKAYTDLQAENQKLLGSFAWADKAKGTVQIPIELAVQLTIPRLQSQLPAPANPIVAPAVPPAPDAGASPDVPEATPAPSVQPEAAPAETPATP
jgi:hypothetical protein